MSQIGFIESVPASGESADASDVHRTGSLQQSLGKDDFLKLLIAQLSHQDPMSPIKSHDFAAQLAQFSSLEQLRSIDNSIGQGVSVDLILTQAINNTLAATLVGKEVTARGDQIELVSGETMDLRFQLHDFAESVKVEILDEGGTVVRVLTAYSLSGGEHMLTWDGRGTEGNRLPEANYRFRMNAMDSEGNSVGAVPLVQGIISSVRYEDGKAVLIVDGIEIPFSDVLEIGLANS